MIVEYSYKSNGVENVNQGSQNLKLDIIYIITNLAISVS